MEASTVNRSDYTHAKGDRYAAKKPTDSNILKGDGTFVAETSTMKEFSPKQGERYGINKRDNADYWKVSNSLPFKIHLKKLQFRAKVPLLPLQLIEMIMLLKRVKDMKQKSLKILMY